MMFTPMRGEASVGEQQPLHEEHDGHAQGAGIRPDQDRGERPAEQVAAGPGSDREVDHLRREDERGDQPGHRGGAVVELLAGSAQADRDAACRDHAGRNGHRGVDETVRHVHEGLLPPGPLLDPVAARMQLQVIRNKVAAGWVVASLAPPTTSPSSQMTDRFQVVPAAYVVFRREHDGRSQVLLQLRRGTGYMDGFWATAAAGHVEADESVLEAACREAAEELGGRCAPGRPRGAVRHAPHGGQPRPDRRAGRLLLPGRALARRAAAGRGGQGGGAALVRPGRVAAPGRPARAVRVQPPQGAGWPRSSPSASEPRRTIPP